MDWTLLCVFALGALMEGIIASAIDAIQSARGVLRIDHSNPDKDVYRIEIDDLDKLSKKKRVYLRIDHNADLRQNNTDYYETD